MYVRSNKGKLIYLNINKFNNDKEKYKNIWNIMYNINVKEKNDKYNNNLIKYIKNKNIFE